MSDSGIFKAAVKLAPDERPAYLDSACRENRELRQEVESLLSAHDATGGWLQGLPETRERTIDYEPIAERPGSVIGPYKLLQQIGEGGFGIVFLAEQVEPVRRRVALKIIKPGMDTRQVIARFEAERQALAVMDHPNIAKVLDAGTTSGVGGQESGVGMEPLASPTPDSRLLTPGSGRPYFVMELVRGIPITQYCDDNQLPIRERLALFASVCQAIQHAHTKGIIHRDIKPTNVLVTQQDGQPLVKVIDFGIAKAMGQQLTEKTPFTEFAQMIGTPLYMSPEQAAMSSTDVDTRSDIYSLGVLLYELLTGSTPVSKEQFKQATFDEIRRIIREDEAPKPSVRIGGSDTLPAIAAHRHIEPARLSRLVRGELDWIVMTCLEKDRNRRYETAASLAADVKRFLSDEPVQACPPSAWYRFRKFARRNKRALATAGLVLFFIVLLGGVVGWGMRDRAARDQEIALEAARKLALTEQGIRQSRADLQDILKKPGGVQQLLNQPARWELFMKTAQGELAQARRLAVRTEGGLDAELTEGMDKLEQQLRSDQADYDLARHLEKVRMDWANLVDGRYDSRKSAEAYRQAFAAFGVLNDDPAAVAARLGSSPIKEQLVAALDDWAFLSLLMSQEGTAEQLLALARQVAPDPVWGDRLRQLKVWRDPKALDKLMAETPAAGLSPQLYGLVGRRLIPETNQPLRESWLRRAQAEHPADFWVNFHLASILETTCSVEATGFYRVAIAVRPGTSLAYNNLGKTLFDQKNLPEAIAAFDKAIELDPKHAMAYYNRGVVLNHQKKRPEAVDALRKAIAIDPKYVDAYVELGRALNAQEKLPEAIAAFRKAIGIDPKQADTYFELGVALKAQGKLDEAIDAYRNAIEIDPNYAKAHYNLGHALATQKKLPEAIDAYRKAIEIDPKDADAHTNLGNALRDEQKLPEAIEAYHKAIEIDPKHSLAYHNLGIALTRQGKLDEAIDAYRKVIEIDPKNAKAYHNLGIALTRQGELDEAIAAFREAIKIDPKYAWAYNNLGWALYEQKKLPEAIAAYRKAIEIDPKNPQAHANLALALRNQGELNQAIEAYHKAIEINPQDAVLHCHLGLAHYWAGNWEEALAALQQSMDLSKGGTSTDWFFLAMAHWRLGNKDEARKWYDRAVEWMEKHEPNDEELRRFRTEAAELLEVEKKLD